jgi:alkylation response protein AidB-like acyl-CoA dehydrogenase
VSALELAPADAQAAGRIEEFFAPRAADVDAGRAGVREGLALLAELGLPEADVERSAELISLVARHDLASAFSAWAHRMTIEYVGLAPRGSSLHRLLPELRAGTLLGATALAAGTARHLSGAPLPVTYRELPGGELRLDGRIPWASNLLPPFVAVTAVAHADDPEKAFIVALSDQTPGLSLAPYPDLLALGATGSTSVGLEDARVPGSWLVSAELGSFIDGILPRFLLLQSAFCLGLAGAALDAASANQSPLNSVLQPELERLASQLDGARARLRASAQRVDRDGPAGIDRRELLNFRLSAALLAGEAVRTELASAGGRGFMRASATARRVREAAFLPVQAPTEVQLRWLLASHSA